MLIKYATELLQNHQILQAIELYRKANHFIDAAKLLTEVNHTHCPHPLLLL